jgi:hypothetical protein
MIPVAASLVGGGHNVWFASGAEHLKLIESELPQCGLVSFPGFKPRYSRHLPQYIWMLFKIPSLVYHAFNEHFKLKKIIKEYSIDIVISDNRFGLWNSGITSVYVTHMPRIPFPHAFRYLEPVGIFLHRLIIKQYDWLLIPDMPGEPNLSGRLSHGLKLPDNTRYVGILSRFSGIKSAENPNKVHNLIILSGPEPQKTMLRQKLTDVLKNTPNTVILGGAPGTETENTLPTGITFHSHLTTYSMFNTIISSKTITARSGYSTIMDLATIGCSALLVPTPGQTEQEYLAARLAHHGMFASIEQKRINSQTIIPNATPKNTMHTVTQSHTLLKNALEEILNGGTVASNT